MFRRLFGKLIWKDNTFIRPQKAKRNMLTLEEANERLHRYFPNMDILIYRGTGEPALVHCKDCEKNFETANIVGSYFYGKRTECEHCRKARLDEIYSKYVNSFENITYLGFRSKDYKTSIVFRCDICGEQKEVQTSYIPNNTNLECSKCKEEFRVNKAKAILSDFGKNYISYFYAIKGIDTNIRFITYKCNVCGEIKNISENDLFNYIGSRCETCFAKETTDIYKQIMNKYGLMFLDRGARRKVKGIHLFCGSLKEARIYDISDESCMCRKCTMRARNGKLKDHNKHLVEEELVMLKNVQSFKNAWLKQVPDALEKLEGGFVKTILTHIDGWINNYEAIIEKYPNGDLGTVIENNPLYKQVEDTFYPIMEKFGFKR